MGKAKKVFSRLIGTIITLVLVLVGVVLFVTLGPVAQYSYESPEVLGTTVGTLVTLTVVGFLAIFGGTDTNCTYTVFAYVNGKEQGDPLTTESTINLNLDYFALIALILVVVGTVLFLLFYRNKLITLVSGLATLIGAILGGCQPLTYGFVNPDISDSLSSLAHVGGTSSIIGIGSIIFAILVGIAALFMLAHACFIDKKHK